MDQRDRIIEYIDLVSPSLPPHWKALQKEELPFPVGFRNMLHVSPDNNLGAMIPQVSSRRASSEDNTTPRIPVAPSLIGCLLAKQNDVDEFYQERGEKYKGGWVVYDVPFDWCIEPGKEIVADADSTGEHWIVGYDEAHQSIIPKPIAKCFHTQIIHEGCEGSDGKQVLNLTAIMFLHVYDDCVLPINHAVRMIPGKYRLELRNWGDHLKIHWKTYKDFCCSRISDEQYFNAKDLTASMLSYQEHTSAKW